jgi:hypothetical protein
MQDAQSVAPFVGKRKSLRVVPLKIDLLQKNETVKNYFRMGLFLLQIYSLFQFLCAAQKMNIPHVLRVPNG